MSVYNCFLVKGQKGPLSTWLTEWLVNQLPLLVIIWYFKAAFTHPVSHVLHVTLMIRTLGLGLGVAWGASEEKKKKKKKKRKKKTTRIFMTCSIGEIFHWRYSKFAAYLKNTNVSNSWDKSPGHDVKTVAQLYVQSSRMSSSNCLDFLPLKLRRRQNDLLVTGVTAICITDNYASILESERG